MYLLRIKRYLTSGLVSGVPTGTSIMLPGVANMLRSGRQPQPKAGADPHFAVDADRTAVCFDDFLGNRQAQTGTLGAFSIGGFDLFEPFENDFEMRLRNSPALIYYSQLAATIPEFGRKRHDATIW